VSAGSVADSLDKRAGTDGALSPGNQVRVADVAVIAAPDPVLGERVCAVVVPRPGCSFDVAEARAHFAAAGAARQKTPEVVVLADELPRTPAGKVRKEVLRARLKGSPGGAGLGPLRSG
jgi:acyl-CoA synthetase (AMP-forming)/AMP-acid ligase II